jgi:hypothetical protein
LPRMGCGGAWSGSDLPHGAFICPELDFVEPDYGAAFQQVSLRIKKRSLVVLFTQIADEVAAGELLHVCKGLCCRHLPLIAMMRDPQIDALVKGIAPQSLGYLGPLPMFGVQPQRSSAFAIDCCARRKCRAPSCWKLRQGN